MTARQTPRNEENKSPTGVVPHDIPPRGRREDAAVTPQECNLPVPGVPGGDTAGMIAPVNVMT